MFIRRLSPRPSGQHSFGVKRVIRRDYPCCWVPWSHPIPPRRPDRSSTYQVAGGRPLGPFPASSPAPERRAHVGNIDGGLAPVK